MSVTNMQYRKFRSNQGHISASRAKYIQNFAEILSTPYLNPGKRQALRGSNTIQTLAKVKEHSILQAGLR